MAHHHVSTQRPWLSRQWIRISCWLVGLGLRPLYRLHVEGVETLPAQGGVVIVSNHISLFDTLIIPYTILAAQKAEIVWAPAKEELFQMPIIGRILLSWGVFPIRRGRSDIRAMRRMLTHMSTGKMMLFPEGTRSSDGRLQKGKRMVGKLLHQARPVVIPVAVYGTDRLFLSGKRLPRWRTPVSVRYGQPLDLQKYYALPNTKDTAEAMVHHIMAAIAALLPPSASAPLAPVDRLAPPEGT